MNLAEYQKRAMETAVYPNIGNNLPYAVLGLIGEWGELEDELRDIRPHSLRIRNEMGDCYWFAADCAFEIGYTLKNVDTKPIITCFISDLETCENFCREALYIMAQHTSKNMRDSSGESRSLIVSCLSEVLQCLDQLCYLQGFSREEILEENIQKLTDRKARNVIHGSGGER